MPTLRPASHVMSPERAGATFPTALSFTRSFCRRMMLERWRMSVVRRDLDAEGRGDALYKLTGNGQEFHLLVVSTVYPQHQKVDRSFGINWDISAALCQGEWSTQREERLKPEIPKQYLGRYDSDTLCFTRGNRSERIFDEVVDALADGSQPDPAMLASVGYIFRTTAFAGNGLFGMRPYDGLDPDHPLGEPYHLQMAAAFMLREFVFDLVDHLARARSPKAVALDPSIKRYLGIGNSAGQGLIPFVASHPHLIHRWCLTLEQALAEATSRPSDERRNDVKRLLDKAIRYFEEDPRDGNGIFMSYATLAAELRTVRKRLEDEEGRRATDWRSLLDGALVGLGHETCEVIYTIVLEVYPETVARFETGFRAKEPFDTNPGMTTAEIGQLVETRYAWTRPPSVGGERWTANFWYQPEEAPDEPRRGRRGISPEFEFESKMDFVLGLERLRDAVTSPCPYPDVADLLAARPDLREVVRRVQSVAHLDYAELRQSYVSADYTPFAGERLLLSFYGMEKLDPRSPRSIKGAFLQGAPTAADIAAGRDGEWPFPLIPRIASAKPVATRQASMPLRKLETPEQSPTAIRKLASGRDKRSLTVQEIPFFSVEYRKLMVRALLVAGVSLGVAEAITRMGEFADAVSGTGMPELLRWLPELCKQPRVQPEIKRHRFGTRLFAGREPAFLLLPAALDLAHAAALHSESGFGAVTIDNAFGHALFDQLAYLAACRGAIGLIGWRQDGDEGSTVALPGESGIELWRSANMPTWLVHLLSVGDEVSFEPPLAAKPAWRVPRPFFSQSVRAAAAATVVACLAPSSVEGGAKAIANELRTQQRIASELQASLITASELEARLSEALTSGYKMTACAFLTLEAFAKRWLLPSNLEPKITQATVPCAN